jgi:hypothetical protein
MGLKQLREHVEQLLFPEWLAQHYFSSSVLLSATAYEEANAGER